MKKLKFIIFTAGVNNSNKVTHKFFDKACTDILKKRKFEISIVDILKDASIAEERKILAIPTIVRCSPMPEKRIIGDIKDLENARRAIEYLTNDLE